MLYESMSALTLCWPESLPPSPLSLSVCLSLLFPWFIKTILPIILAESSAIKKVSIASRNRRTSTEERDGKDGDSESRSSRLISAYLADDSYNAGKDIVRKVSIEEKVFKRPDKEKKVSTTVTEEEIRISPPEVSDDVPRRKLSNKGEKQRRSSEERKKKKEEKKGKNSKEEKFRSVSFAQVYCILIWYIFSSNYVSPSCVTYWNINLIIIEEFI